MSATKTPKRGRTKGKSANGAGGAKAHAARSPTLAKLLDRGTRRYQIAMACWGAARRTKGGAELLPWTRLPDADRGRMVAAVKLTGGAAKAKAGATSGAGDAT